jgi:hypothetical protein
MMKFKIEKATEQDLIHIGSDICDRKGEIYGVVSRCATGFPLVVVLNPVKNSETGELNTAALDNILWITCPAIHKRISELEAGGVIERVRQLLASDRIILTEMTNAHAHYYYFRKEVYRRITGVDYTADMIQMFDSGIGGAQDPKEVDCLHVHYAHYMICKSNIVGRAIEGYVAGAECDGSGCGCVN